MMKRAILAAAAASLLAGLNLPGAEPAPAAPGPAALAGRGVNWGWWGCVEPGDAEALKAQGAGLLRIAFPYSKIAPDGRIAGDGIAVLDALCRQADTAGIPFILDCHEPPGGCNPAAWCAEGRNAIWTDAQARQRFVSMWRELAARYRTLEHLHAYELMNEPCPPEGTPVTLYTDLILRAVDAIREEDPTRPIVVGGLDWNAPGALTDDILLPRDNIVYTFHFYAPAELTHYAGGDARYPGRMTVGTQWLGNSPEGEGSAGTLPWHLVERQAAPPEGATCGRVILRSVRNRGTARFDDVVIIENGEPLALPNASFDPTLETSGWTVERRTEGIFEFDPTDGADAPGCLRISGTNDYNGLQTDTTFPVRPGAEYRVRCRIRTTGATGLSYPMIAWFEETVRTVDRDYLLDALAPALEFRDTHGVPLFCGEFGCSMSVPDGSGIRWIRDVASLLDANRVPWTYWNWKETTGPGSMGIMVRGPDGRFVPNGPLAAAMADLWRPRADTRP